MGTPAAATPDPDDRPGRTDPPSGPVCEPPFGLAVLAEVPELAGLLELASLLQLAVDTERMTARLVEALIVLEDAGVAPAATGVGLEQWLAIVGRSTRSDRRMLTTAAAVCRRLPTLRTAFAAGEVSWSQVRAVALKVERTPRHLDDRLDAALARAIDGAAGADPDALSNVVSWTVTDLQSDDGDDDGAVVPDDIFVLQPRLDGSGGRFHGDFGPVGFAALDTVTDPGPLGTATRDRFGDRPDDDALAANRLTAGRARAARLIDLCRRGGPTDHAQTGSSDGGHGEGGAGAVRPPTLIMRAELDTLLGDHRLSAQLLTTLAGGVMHVDSRTARRLVDEHGTDLRLVLLEDGKVVGVGTRTRRPPGWLADAALAVHDTCTEPGNCPTAARVCDLDHAVPATAGGPTDIANLAPLCRTANRRKEADGWTATGTADGTRTWHHPRTGLTVRTLPTTWRPPDDHHRGPPVDLDRGGRRGPPDRHASDTRRSPPPRAPDRTPPQTTDPPGDPPDPVDPTTPF
ncbi:HNH endonuclease signature motif containing protein [Nitriliruptor alkaliphilus]|uniref:HNH endonuclease signature motif containing protein n=1 Tax=Nitriliruptor alkaliphilus TaxID=427918 RepID=UPI0006972DF3|nr:HNH endonuclease signature motif containing protein [Nitriliruptor alkaliphilus]